MVQSLFLILLISCTLKHKQHENLLGHQRLYSQPEALEMTPLASHERRLVFVSTNDIQGHLEPNQISTKDTHSPERTLLSLGGAQMLERYLTILRTQYPGEVVLLDAGDALSGSLMSRSSGARAVRDMFEQLNYDAVGLSVQDLAAGPALKAPSSPADWVPALFEKARVPLVLSNLLDLRTGAPVEWGNSQPQLLKEVNGVKIGFLSLIPDDVARRLDGNALNGLYVEPTLQSLLKQTRKLRLKGAQLVVLLMHGGINCGEQRAKEKNLPIEKVNFDPHDPKICDTSGTLAQLLAQTPPGSIDLVITGGGVSKVSNVLHGVPVLQAFPLGSSFVRAELVWDLGQEKLVKEKTVIHQPVLLCHRFFKGTEDCYHRDPSVDHRQLMPARFLGEPVMATEEKVSWMEVWRELLDHHSAPLLENTLPLNWEQEAAEALLKVSNSDVSVVGGDDWRMRLPRGLVSWREIYHQPSAREHVLSVEITRPELALLREKLNRVWWSFAPIASNEQHLRLSLNQRLWQEQVSQYLPEKFIHTAPLMMADALINWESDLVSWRASGRSPALPRTQF